MTIGPVCHEMGHGFWDMPDVYDYDNSSVGLGRWSRPGLYTVAVTASNACRQLTATLDVSVTTCTALTGISLAGPARLQVGQEGTFLAAPEPLPATQPLYHWSNGSTEPTAVYSWTLAGNVPGDDYGHQLPGGDRPGSRAGTGVAGIPDLPAHRGQAGIVGVAAGRRWTCFASWGSTWGAPWAGRIRLSR